MNVFCPSPGNECIPEMNLFLDIHPEMNVFLHDHPEMNVFLHITRKRTTYTDVLRSRFRFRASSFSLSSLIGHSSSSFIVDGTSSCSLTTHQSKRVEGSAVVDSFDTRYVVTNRGRIVCSSLGSCCLSVLSDLPQPHQYIPYRRIGIENQDARRQSTIPALPR